jgi:hypothetical protein
MPPFDCGSRDVCGCPLSSSHVQSIVPILSPSVVVPPYPMTLVLVSCMVPIKSWDMEVPPRTDSRWEQYFGHGTMTMDNHIHPDFHNQKAACASSALNTGASTCTYKQIILQNTKAMSIPSHSPGTTENIPRPFPSTTTPTSTPCTYPTLTTITTSTHKHVSKSFHNIQSNMKQKQTNIPTIDTFYSHYTTGTITSHSNASSTWPSSDTFPNDLHNVKPPSAKHVSTVEQQDSRANTNDPNKAEITSAMPQAQAKRSPSTNSSHQHPVSSPR